MQQIMQILTAHTQRQTNKMFFKLFGINPYKNVLNNQNTRDWRLIKNQK